MFQELRGRIGGKSVIGILECSCYIRSSLFAFPKMVLKEAKSNCEKYGAFLNSFIKKSNDTGSVNNLNEKSENPRCRCSERFCRKESEKGHRRRSNASLFVTENKLFKFPTYNIWNQKYWHNFLLPSHLGLIAPLQRGKRPTNECSGYGTKNLMIKFQWCWSFGERGVPLHWFLHLNCVLMLNWIARNRTVLTSKMCTYGKLNYLK